MKPSHIEHIGIAVRNLEVAIKFYEKIFGLKFRNWRDSWTSTYSILQGGQTKIELLESTDPEGAVSKFIEKKGEGVHHIALL